MTVDRPFDDEEEQLRQVALQNAQAILLARRRAEEDLHRAREELERKNHELEDQKEWFEVTLSSIGDAVITTDIDGRITFMNQVAVELTGWSRDDAVDQPLANVFNIVSEITRAPAQNPVELALRDGKIVALANHTLLIRRDGVETAIEDSAAPIRTHEGEIIGAVMVFHDVAAKRTAAAALLEESRALEILNMTGAVITSQLDYDGAVKTVTDAATKLSGAEFGAFFYTRTDEEGRVFALNYVSGADPALFRSFGHPRATPVFAPTFEGKPPVRVDDITKDPRYGQWGPHHGMPKGHLPVCSYLAVPVISRDGSVIGGLFFGHSRPGIFTERSERIVSGIAGYAAIAIDNARLYEEAQREIAKRQKVEAALKEADKRKDEFLALLAHELRNPLAPIRQIASLWQLGALDDDKLRWSQKVIERQSEHMSLLLDDLLDISRIKRGSLVLRKEWLKLGAIVDAALEASSPLIVARQHALDVNVDADLHLEADPVRLTQVLANLLNNAAKYTPAGGRIALTAQQKGAMIEIRVNDNGIGIAEEQLPRVFEIFFQSTATIDRVDGGLGLGLALVKGIAELHDGDVAVSSAGLGKGTAFTVRLPVGTRIAETAQPAAAQIAPRTAPSTKRLLVADDNHDSADTLAMYLRKRGFDVTTVYSGEEVLEVMRTAQFDWIIMDIGMPRLNGYDTARHIRVTEPARALKLVAVTGWGQDADRRKAIEAGFDHHYTKPVNPPELVDLIERESESSARQA